MIDPRSLNRLFHENDGVSSIEYALLAALIVLVIAAGAVLLGSNLEVLFNGMANDIVEAVHK